MHLPVTDEILHKVIGMNAAGVKKACIDYFGPEFDYESFRKTVGNYMQNVLETEGMPVKRGLPELLTYLKQNHYQTAVASSSPQTTVENYLRRAGMETDFSALICGDMVKKASRNPTFF